MEMSFVRYAKSINKVVAAGTVIGVAALIGKKENGPQSGVQTYSNFSACCSGQCYLSADVKVGLK